MFICTPPSCISEYSPKFAIPEILAQSTEDLPGSKLPCNKVWYLHSSWILQKALIHLAHPLLKISCKFQFKLAMALLLLSLSSALLMLGRVRSEVQRKMPIFSFRRLRDLIPAVLLESLDCFTRRNSYYLFEMRGDPSVPLSLPLCCCCFLGLLVLLILFLDGILWFLLLIITAIIAIIWGLIVLWVVICVSLVIIGPIS